MKELVYILTQKQNILSYLKWSIAAKKYCSFLLELQYEANVWG